MLMADGSTPTVRGLGSEDWTSLYPLWHNEAVLRDSTELPYPDEDSFRERFSSAPENTHVLIVEAGLPSGRKRLVGASWLESQMRRRRHTGTLNLIVHPDYRQTKFDSALLEKNIALADTWLGLRRLEVLVFASDTAAQQLYEAHGFVKEAVVRHYARRDGILADGVLLARVIGLEA